MFINFQRIGQYQEKIKDLIAGVRQRLDKKEKKVIVHVVV